MSDAETAFSEILTLPLYDPEPLDQLRSLLGPEMVAELVAEFESSGVENLARLDQAIRQGDCVTAQREAHSLKSASASLGLSRLSRLCFAVESDCRDGRLGVAMAGQAIIAENYAEACRFLQQMKAV